MTTQDSRSAGRSWLTPGIFAAALMSSVATVAIGGDPAPFTEAASVRGINYAIAGELGQFGYGAAFVDLDNDGDPDLVVLGRADGVVGVYENDGTGNFIDRSAGSGIPIMDVASGVAASDYDGDGYLDLYITQFLFPNVLLRNVGGFAFEDVTDESGTGDPWRGEAPSFGDFDGDGWVDLYVANYATFSYSNSANLLYRNNGDGTFTDVASDVGVNDIGLGYQGIWFDYDLDGDSDLYVSNDRGNLGWQISNKLFENVGGTFVDVSEESNTDIRIYSMGVAVGDLDENRYPDLYCTNIAQGSCISPFGGYEGCAGNRLLLNQEDGVFVHAEEEAGVQSFRAGWAAAFLDYNNNTFLEVFVCNQNPTMPNRMYVCDGEFPCTDMASSLNLDDNGNSYGLAIADIDGDGDLDLAVTNNNEPMKLWINNEGEARRWIRFNVLGEGANLFGIGTTVDTRIGDKWQLREVHAGQNYKSQNELTVHVGADDALVADEVVVTWIGGTTRTLTNLATNNTWTLYPPSLLFDADGDHEVSLPDYATLVDCTAGPVVGSLLPGCEMMDHDGDADIDLRDVAAFFSAFGSSFE